MTEDFKKLVLKYMLGQLDEQQPSSNLNWSDLKTTQNNLYTYLQEFFNGDNWSITGTLQGNSTTNPLGFTVLYGFYGLAGETKGFITILDEKFTPLSTLTSYSSGTEFNEFVALNVDEDGNFYGIDRTDTQYRFVLLNNFLVKTPSSDYQVILRNSYFLPNTYQVQNVSIIRKVLKRVGHSTYLIPFLLGQGLVSGYPTVLEFTINVGSENNWVAHQSNTNFSNAIISDLTFNYIDDVLNFKLALQDYSTSKSLEVQFDGNSYSIKTFDINAEILYLNYNDAYASKSIYETNKITYCIYKVNYNTYSLDNVYTYENDGYSDYGTQNVQGAYLFKNQNELFAEIIIGDDSTHETYSYKILKIVGSEVYEKELGSFSNGALYLNLFFVSKQYNLYSYYIQSQNTVYQVNQIYNELNYNGDSYEDINSLFPNTGNLYSDNQLIFSRGLYNKVVNGNTTTSTIEVPNTLLNDTNITSEELVSHTSTSLVKENQSISKNIYELLYINFINSLIVQNRNSSSYQDMPTIASALNQSICSTLNYDDIKLTKWRITFSDNSTKIGTLTTTKVSDYAYNLKFIFYTSKDIKSIELISNDENVVYLTINELNLSLNKIYKISQNVEVI